MHKQDREALLALPIILAVGAGLAWAGSQHGLSAGPLSVYGWCVLWAFGLQWLAFVPAYLAQTEKYYDLIGSLTYLSTLGLALALSGPPRPLALLLAALIGVWALRLGSFLFLRIKATGADSRFDDIKPHFARFLMAWTLQGLWVCFSLAAALAALTTAEPRPAGWLAIAGALVWGLGFGLEALADRQKNAFRKDPANAGRFIQHGLWAWSRHPNYFGEITLWCGIALMALPQLQGWQYLSLISPVFIYILLTRISGVPMLEAKSDQRWGGQPDYEAYKARTPVLVLRPPRALSTSPDR